MPFFDFGSVELMLIGIIALIVVGPKDLPKLMRAAGQALAKVRGAARHFKSGVDEMMRQAELDDMQSKWDAHNKSVMTGAPAGNADTSPTPTPDTVGPATTGTAPSDAPKPDSAPSDASGKP